MSAPILNLSVICAVLTVGLAGIITDNLVATPSCREVNSAADKVLSNINTANKGKSRDFIIPDQTINPTFYGFKVSLKSGDPVALKSSVSNFDRLSRLADTDNCSLPIFSSVDGQFTVGPVVWTFPNTTTSFWFLESVGSIVQTAELSMEIAVVQGTMDCRLEAFKLLEINNLMYEFVNETWKGWILGKIVSHALSSMDNNQLISQASAAITKSIAEDFGNQWCQQQAAIRSM